MERGKPKSKLLKSKSSNSTLTQKKKSEQSRSSTGLQKFTIRKRGLYVKSRLEANTGLNNIVRREETQNLKAPKRPSRGTKNFVDSVLNLLSQSSTGTQVPENTVTMKNKTKTLNKYRIDYDTNAMLGKNTTAPKTEKKKRKYSSKDIDALDRVNYLEVIQPRKDIVMTPSIKQSDTSKLDADDFGNIKWSDFLPRLVKPDEDEIKIEKEKKLSSLAKEVNEGRMGKPDDPKTLVGDKSKTDHGLYSFFVDLLETTFSVYNVDARYDDGPNIPSGLSDVSFEINESVAKKLDISPDREPPPSPDTRCHSNLEGRSCCNEKLLNNFVCKKSESQVKRTEKQPKQAPQKVARQKKLRSEFVFPKQKPLAPKSKSATNTQQKKSNKQNNKKNLLKMFKEQLRMDDSSFEEPQNLYQALKVMAKTKKKSQKTIHFDLPKKIHKDEKCTFKNKNVISPKSKTRSKQKGDEVKNPSGVSPKLSEYNHGRRRDIFESSSEDDLSNHSLEVYNVDYDTPQTPLRRCKKKPKELIFTYHSSDSEEEQKPYDPMVPIMQQIIMTVETICSADKRNSTDFTDNCFTSVAFSDDNFETV